MNSVETPGPNSRAYREYSQHELDAQYNNRARFPDFSEHFERWQRWSEDSRSRLACELNVPFGDSAEETLDIFPAEKRGAAIYVFIHGGYWYSLDKSHYSYVADGMLPHGVTTVVNNFALAPDADMDTIVAQNRSAMAWLWRNAASHGADPSRIYVCGHSAGGHLGVMLLATDWRAYGDDLPVDVVKGVCAIGGIFDLEPIRRSYLNHTLNLDEAQARRNSPIAQTYPASAPLSLVVADDESDEFHRQSRIMHEHWASLGYPVTSMVPDGLDHFNVVNDLADPQCPLVTHQLEQMSMAFAPTPPK